MIARDPEQVAGRRAAAQAVSLAVVGSILAPLMCGFEVDLVSFWQVLAAVAAFAVIAIYANWRGMMRLNAASEVSALTLVGSFAALVLTFASMGIALPLHDQMLAAADDLLGFQWLTFLRLVDQSPVLSHLLDLSYRTFGPQIVAIPIALALSGNPVRAYHLVTSLIILFLIASVVSCAIPAMGAYPFYDISIQSLKNVTADMGTYHMRTLNLVRTQDYFKLSSSNAAGIITFPSVHAGVALLLAHAALTSKRIFWPLLLLNILMFVSAITQGGHYLVDVLGGGAAAAFAISATRMAFLHNMRRSRANHLTPNFGTSTGETSAPLKPSLLRWLSHPASAGHRSRE